MTCAGGDNNLGLALVDPEVTSEKPAVNDTIVGRKSSAFIAKVCFAFAFYVNFMYQFPRPDYFCQGRDLGVLVFE